MLKKKQLKKTQKKRKLEENKKTEEELWDKLKGLSKEFKDIKEQQQQ